MNFVRVHQKTNPERYYWHADRLGVVVAQDMVQHYGDCGRVGPPTGSWFNGHARARYYFHDLKAMIDARANHVSIIQYETFNENDMVSEFNVTHVVRWTRWYDPTRLVDADSGGEGLGDLHIGDVNDFHAGEWPPTGPTAGPSGTQYAMAAEYGGLPFAQPSHQWSQTCDWDMLGPPLKSSHDVAMAFVNVTNFFIINRSFSAAGYVQLADIERECDGLLNYDRSRRFDDADVAMIRAQNRKLVQTPIPCTLLP